MKNRPSLGKPHREKIMSRTTEIIREQRVRVLTGSVALEGSLGLPEEPLGVVLFAHGSGSGQDSPRNRYVASRLQESRLATLLVDLLTEREELEDHDFGLLRFAMKMLADRLVGVTDWLKRDSRTLGLPVGYFGASTGGGAALIAAARCSDQIGAVVLRGGRPDLAGDDLWNVRAPTLLIVGGDDGPVIGLNESAFERLGSPVKRLEIVPGASHLFEEPGKLEEVAWLAAEWFVRYLSHPWDKG